MPARFDVAIVGGGPGGYVAALRAAQLGAKTALVERDRVGGTCLVRGCIPTKALLQSAELYSLVQRGAGFGIETQGLSFDFKVAQARKTKVVDQLVKGVEGLLKAAGVEVFRGQGRLRSGGGIDVDGVLLEARDIIVASGSLPSRIPLKGVEHTVDSDGILEIPEIPKRLVVIGGGVVGMEWGALFAALGSQVVVLEMLPTILPMAEADIVAVYHKHFEGMGGVIHTEAKVEEVAKAKGALKVSYWLKGERQQADASVVLLATGRIPNTDGLGLDQAGVELERGRVKVDEHLRTGAPGVWAVGDVIGGIMLAHVASYEGVCAVENIVEGKQRVPDYHAAPNCIYTDPEIAHVGLGEKEAREQGFEIQVGRFPFQASGRALTLGQSEGFVKVVAEAASGRLLGVHMVGPRVTDLISEATLAVQHGLQVDDIEQAMHAHPTLAESLLEAALASQGRAIHVASRRPRAAPAAASAAAQPVATQSVSEPEITGSAAPPTQPPAPDGKGEIQEESILSRPVQEKPVDLPEPEPPVAKVSPGRLELKKENRDKLLELHRLMCLIRRFEERTQEQYTKAKIGGFCHLNIGEEATVVGSISPLAKGDYIFTSYREHGHAIARGLDPKAIMAELFGKETGISRGRGGSMHMFDLAHRFMGGYGIVGGHLPLAVGVGWTIRYTKASDVVLCLFGDGATNIGAFHESLNFSKVFKLPVVWFCVNNQYGMGTTVERASAVTEMYKKACAYDMEAITVDGMNVLEILEKSSEVIEKTRADQQPRFIEAVTYRFRGHSVADPDKYRSSEEKERWKLRDPILFFQSDLKEAGVAGDEDFQRVREEIEKEVEEIVRFADQSPDPPLGDLHKNVYTAEWEVQG